MKDEIQHIVALLHKTYEGKAWHGPSVKEALADLNENHARLGLPDTHTIIELVAHLTAWKRYVTKRLAGDLTYTVTDALNFPAPDDWQRTLKELDDSQRQLLAAVEAFPPEKLQQQIPGASDLFTYYEFLHGILHHDLYHAGQIVLMRKALAKQSI